MNKIDLIKLLLEDGNCSSSDCSSENTFLEIGGEYLFRTVTMIYTGRIKEIRGDEILLEKAAWIAETERWHDCLKNSTFKEVEPYVKDVIIYKGAMLDVTKIDKLPTEQE